MPHDLIASQRRFFDKRANRYDQLLFRSRWPRNQLLKADLLLHQLGPAAIDGPVLELGCGTGQIAEAMLDRRPQLRYYGVDLSERMTAAAMERLCRFGARAQAETMHGDISHVGDRSVAAAFGVDVLHHVPDPTRTLQELARVVYPGGPIVFLESNPKFPLTTVYALLHREEHAVLRFSIRHLRGLFRSAGLIDAAVTLGPVYTPPGPSPLVAMYDQIDAMCSRLPVIRALSIFYVARGFSPSTL